MAKITAITKHIIKNDVLNLNNVCQNTHMYVNILYSAIHIIQIVKIHIIVSRIFVDLFLSVKIFVAINTQKFMAATIANSKNHLRANSDIVFALSFSGMNQVISR